MASVTYGSLFSDIESKFSTVESQRMELYKRKKAGLKKIEHLKRVHPRSTPQYWEERKKQIEGIRAGFGTISGFEKELTKSESALKEQKKMLEERKAGGWKIRKKGEGVEFYKPAPKPQTKWGNIVSTQTGDRGQVLKIVYDTGIIRYPEHQLIVDPKTKVAHSTASQFVKLDKHTVVQKGLEGWFRDKQTYDAYQKARVEGIPEEKEKMLETDIKDIPLESDTEIKPDIDLSRLPTLKGKGITVIQSDIKTDKKAPTYQASTLVSRMGTTASMGELSQVQTHHKPKEYMEFHKDYSTPFSDWKVGDVNPYLEAFDITPPQEIYTKTEGEYATAISDYKKEIVALKSSIQIENKILKTCIQILDRWRRVSKPFKTIEQKDT